MDGFKDGYNWQKIHANCFPSVEVVFFFFLLSYQQVLIFPSVLFHIC